jgi:hypothetical protein
MVKYFATRPDEENEFFSLPNLPAALGLGFIRLLTEMSSRNRRIMFLRSKAWLVHRADNLSAICEPIG